MSRRILVTSALPYANGPIHLGHLVEYIQTDIYVRFLKMTGRDAIYLCASDSHGTPIEIGARKQGIPPEELIERYRSDHVRDFAGFQIAFDCYHTTHSPENERHATSIYERLKAAGHIDSRPVEQFYCAEDKRFLPDRYIRGTCPRCGAPDQYGDVCEACGSTHAPTDLAQPACALCGSRPELRSSRHLFFRLADFEERLREWTSAPGHLQPEVRHFVETWMKDGLKEWDISRDGPYFGFRIPDEDDKYFYVWLDAPIGYIATTEKFCRESGRDFDSYWSGDGAEIVHFIGKDIVYFHTLFWPAMLMGAGYSLPSAVRAHGFLTVGGKKMSKSRGTFITARKYLDLLDPIYLRFYYASKLGPGIDDIDLSADDFTNQVNAGLVNNLANLVSRAASFLSKRLEGRLGSPPGGPGPFATALAASDRIQAAYAVRDNGAAVRAILELGDLANEYLQRSEPWKLMQTDPEAARAALTEALSAAKLITIYLAPVAPSFSAAVWQILGHDRPLDWSDIGPEPAGSTIRPFVRLIERVDPEQVARLMTAEPESPAPTAVCTPVKAQVSIDDFGRLDLRAALVVSAEAVPGSDKLLKLVVDIGSGHRTVLAGIARTFRPDDLPGRTLVCVCNLAPRRMKSGTSEGMILASGPDPEHLVLAEVPGVAPGTAIA